MKYRINIRYLEIIEQLLYNHQTVVICAFGPKQATFFRETSKLSSDRRKSPNSLIFAFSEEHCSNEQYSESGKQNKSPRRHNLVIVPISADFLYTDIE